jgi:hypothetical protein
MGQPSHVVTRFRGVPCAVKLGIAKELNMGEPSFRVGGLNLAVVEVL